MTPYVCDIKQFMVALTDGSMMGNYVITEVIIIPFHKLEHPSHWYY
jgi:hypothetical protein